MGLERLDDEDYPALSVGQAAELLGVQPAFLRRLDAAGVLHLHRTAGGHRRYSRRQLALAARLRELFDEGHTLAAAMQITALEDDLGQTSDERDQVREDLVQAQEELVQAREELVQAREELADLHQRQRPGFPGRRGARSVPGGPPPGCSAPSSA